MTDEEKRAATLADRVITGLLTLEAPNRKKVLGTILKLICADCGHQTCVCQCQGDCREGAAEKAAPTQLAGCPSPVGDDDGSVTQCVDRGHCSCSERIWDPIISTLRN